jgi:hypothetical protein
LIFFPFSAATRAGSNYDGEIVAPVVERLLRFFYVSVYVRFGDHKES